MISRINTVLMVFLSSIILFCAVPVIHFATAIKHEMNIPSPLKTFEFDEFGLSSEALTSETNIAGKKDNIYDILNKAGVPNGLTFRVLREGTEFFEGFSSGTIYRTFSNALDPEELLYIVLEKDPVNYVIVDLKNPIVIWEGKKEVTVKRKIIEGRIKTSFYHSLKGNDLNPEVIEKLSEIYQWQIDFYGLKKGDHFKFILEERYVSDTLAAEEVIAGAYFHHDGSDYYAIQYNNGKSVEYYDLSGKHLKKSFLKSPVEFSMVTSPFSDSRFHPILKINKPHLGTDYAAPEGSPVFAVADGLISEASYSASNGNFVRIIHDETYSTQYLHLSRFAKNVNNGRGVRQGDVIGYVGSTGLATGPHLCFRFWKDGEQVDPSKEKFPSYYELEDVQFEKFIAVRDAILSELEEKKYIAFNTGQKNKERDDQL